MKLSLVVCILGLLLVCVSASESSKTREKRIFGFIRKIKDKAKQIIKKVDNAVDKSVQAVKNTAVKGAKYVAKVTKKVVDKTDDIIDDSIDGVKTAVKFTRRITHKAIDRADDILDDGVDGVVKAAKYTAKISKKFGKGVVKISRTVYKKTYDAAKKAFKGIKGLADKVDFDKVVLLMVDLIDSEISNMACDYGCVASAAYLFGPGAVFYADLACPIICEAVLAYLEDVAEDLVEKKLKEG